MKVFVTGGAGFIGSHTCVELLNAGHEVVVVDNLCNSSKESLKRVKKITGKSVKFYTADIRDEKKLDKIVSAEAPFDATIHFAALKAVGESVQVPLKYYENNLGGTFTLLKVLAAHGCKNIVFSSSATVYGQPPSVPPRCPSHPTSAEQHPRHGSPVLYTDMPHRCCRAPRSYRQESTVASDLSSFVFHPFMIRGFPHTVGLPFCVPAL
jgi:UDP-glucose 4-epimerase